MDDHSLLGAYALDAVEDGEREQFEQHLATCDRCWGELPTLMAVSRRLGAVRPREAP